MIYLFVTFAFIVGVTVGWYRRAEVEKMCPDCGQYRGELCADCDEISQAVGELAVTR